MDLAEAARRLADADKEKRDEATSTILGARERAVPALVDTLSIPGAPVARIALLLAALGPDTSARDGLPKLYALLEKGVLDLDTRAVVARALAELVDGRDAFDDASKRSLLRLSKDGHATTRQLTARALEKVGDADCEARLVEMTADANDDVKAAARAALASLRAARPADAAPEAGGLAIDLEALVKQSSGPIPAAVVEDAPTGPFPALVTRLRDPRWAVRNAAVDEAVQQGKAVVATLVDVLHGKSVGAKIGAAQAIARIAPVHGAPDAVEALVDVATNTPAHSDDEKALRPIALKALACALTGGEEGLAQPLLPLTRDADPFVRAGALLCLGRLADRVGARAATLALNDAHEHVKEAAAVALSEGTREEDAELVLPLLAVLGGLPSPPIAVREAILLALARIAVDKAAPDGPATLLRLRHRVRGSLLGVTASLRRTAIAILERCYASDDPPPTGVVEEVLGRLADDHPEVRLLAASFLAQFLEPGLARAVERIEDALDRGERPLSLLCLDALVKHDTAKAKAALEAACEDPDEAIAARAQELVAAFAPKSEEWPLTELTPSLEPASAEPASGEPASGEPASGEPASVEGVDPTHAAAVARAPVVTHARRVRPAQGGGDVVEAKVVDTAEEAGRLRDQLAALKDAGLSDDEKRARRDAILGKF